MPQLLRRRDAPIDWSVHAVANHPVLTSGVGACITAFASTEALMGVFLAMIRWQHGPQAVETWASKRTVREKLRLVETEAGLVSSYHRKVAVRTLDAFTSLSKQRAKLAHGFFGVITDRENQFAWRNASSAAKRMADDLASSNMQASPQSPTWIYTAKDFGELAQACADTFEKIEIALNVLPIVQGLTTPLTSLERSPPDDN